MIQPGIRDNGVRQVEVFQFAKEPEMNQPGVGDIRTVDE